MPSKRQERGLQHNALELFKYKRICKKGKAKFGKEFDYAKVECINDRTEVLIGNLKLKIEK